MKNVPSTTVSFRLMRRDLKLLVHASALSESPGECARRLVLSSLNDEERSALLEEVTEVRAELRSLRHKLGGITVAILCDAGKVTRSSLRHALIRSFPHLLSRNQTCTRYRQRHMKNEPSTTVSFRLMPQDLKLLVHASAGNESPGECARRLVLACLNDEERSALLEELAEVKAELQSLRQKLGGITVAILCDAGKVTRSDAEEFVSDLMGE